MGCCSSSKTVPHSTSPTNAPISNAIKCENPNSNPHQLQQHHDINQGQCDSNDDDDNDEIPISKSFANNQSIVKEVMRLEEFELDNYKNYTNTNNNNMEIKSNENSEEVQIISNDQNISFAEFATETINVENNKSPSYPKHQQEIIKHDVNMTDSYHPFGLIQTDESQNKPTEQHKEEDNEEEIVEDLEALYAENLKQHGFDADKFRTANLSLPKLSENSRQDTTQRSLSADLSSFASSQLSSQLSSNSETVDKVNNNKIDIMNNIDDIIAEEDDDEEFLLQELSRPNSIYQDEINENDNQQIGYIESIKESVKDSNQINNIMDDEDEELMDAILSLELDN